MFEDVNLMGTQGRGTFGQFDNSSTQIAIESFDRSNGAFTGLLTDERGTQTPLAGSLTETSDPLTRGHAYSIRFVAGSNHYQGAYAVNGDAPYIAGTLNIVRTSSFGGRQLPLIFGPYPFCCTLDSIPD